MRKIADWLFIAVIPWIPRRAIYWAVMQAGVISTTGKYSGQDVTTLTFLEVLDRIEQRPAA